MTSGCSIADLELGLAGDLPADREELLHRHLEGCEACSAALEQMAGGKAWCDKTAALLASDDLDESVPSREEWSDVDFTVEHLEPSDEPNVLGRLGGYDVLEIIGRGGMGVVLKGFDRELKRCVAIKVLAPHLAQSSLAKKRFAREAQATAAVLHPNVLAIHQVQAGGRLPFLVMPLVAGESLAQRLTAQGRLELKEILRIGTQAAAGLAAAHEQGLVHRDVKPANILLEKGVERAVLTDFGLARAADDVSMTRWGVIAGTPQYMSPEQARGEPLDGRSDLFGLGCVLYEMATGVSPFRTDSTMATLRRLIDDAPPAMASLNPELPPWFIAIVEHLLQKDPSQRFGSAKEVSELLERCLAHLQQPASVPLPSALPAPAARPVSRLRNVLFKGPTAMIATLGIGLLGMFLMQATEPPEIAGQWSGEGWGQVVLDATGHGEYTGTYSDTVTKRPGKIELRWSRIERRFNGKWSEGEDRFGELSVRLAEHEIRGALTTDPKSKINPATPRLADLSWFRVETAEEPKTTGGTTEAATDSGRHGWPADAPPLAVAPFDATKAKEHQAVWAKHLGVPVETTNSIGMKFAFIPPGEFEMGSTPEEVSRELEEAKKNKQPEWYTKTLSGEAPRHHVRITKPSYVAMYQVTQAEYERVMGVNPSTFTGKQIDVSAFKPPLAEYVARSRPNDGKRVEGKDTSRHPVETVNWGEAKEFCRKLSAIPAERAARRVYRLPTEAEWEYACRCGTATRWYCGDDETALQDYAWFGKNSGCRTHAVGKKQSNAWMLYDMPGNVHEWCLDWYDGGYDAELPADDPPGSATGWARVNRGGGNCYDAVDCRPAKRHDAPSGYRSQDLGLRVWLVLANTPDGHKTVPSAQSLVPSTQASAPIAPTVPADHSQATIPLAK
jgi:serine/threonine-protein kinase